MSNINKEICTKGCHLRVTVTDDPQGVYQFIFNSDADAFSNIYSCEDPLEFTPDVDGIYEIVTLRNTEAVLTEEGLTIGTRTFTPKEIINAIEAPVWILGNTEYDIDDTICICNLKKCLVNLQLQLFQDMLKSCGSSKCKGNPNKSEIDFIFIAVWLIEHYLELGKVEKALEVYKCIQSCGSICKELIKNNRNCGCNG